MEEAWVNNNRDLKDFVLKHDLKDTLSGWSFKALVTIKTEYNKITNKEMLVSVTTEDYYQKQIFQNTLFPQGLVYDSKIEHYRTPETMNRVILYVSDLSKNMGKKENGTFQILSEKSRSVHCGSQISNFLDDFQEIRKIINSFQGLLKI